MTEMNTIGAKIVEEVDLATPSPAETVSRLLESSAEERRAYHSVTDFQKGVAISVWQNSSDEKSQWTKFTESRFPFDCFGVKRVLGPEIGNSCDFWNRYKEDIDNTYKIGCNAFRLSIEWARIEPQQGKIDEEAVTRYHNILDYMDSLGMEANATLHHFVHPQWFEELGAFRKEENIKYFVDWSVTAFKHFGHRIRLWSTFNEPNCAVFLGYIIGVHPPARWFNLGLAGRVLLYKLRAHCEAYTAIKALPGGTDAQIGLVFHHTTYIPKSKGWLYTHVKKVAQWMDYWWAWDVVEEFMLTGKYEWKVPMYGTWITWQYPQGRPPCDWWGVNVYTRFVVSFFLQPVGYPGEIMTDMFYPIVPSAMYDAIKRCAKFGIPMYISENGAPDEKDDRRAIYIQTYFTAMLMAIRDGYDVRGYYYWTLVDNFEWTVGFSMKFGLFEWTRAANVDRVLRDGAKPLIRFYKTMPDNLDELRTQIAKFIAPGSTLESPLRKGRALRPAHPEDAPLVLGERTAI